MKWMPTTKEAQMCLFLHISEKLQGMMKWAENGTKAMMLSTDNRGERCIRLKERYISLNEATDRFYESVVREDGTFFLYTISTLLIYKSG